MRAGNFGAGTIPKDEAMKLLLAKMSIALCLLHTAPQVWAQNSDVLAPNANLAATGIPPIALTTVRAMEKYTVFEPTSLVAWHPTDGSMTVSRRAGQTSQLFRIARAGEKAEQITFFNEPVRGAQWAPRTGEYLLITRDKGGSEANHLFRYDPATKTEVQLTAGDTTNSTGPWNAAKNRLIVRAAPLDKTGKRDPEVTLYALDPKAPEKMETLLTLQGAGWYPALWREKDHKILMSLYISATERKLFEVDLKTKERKEIPEMEFADWDDEADAESAPQVFVRRYDEGKGEFRKLFRLDTATGKRTPVSPEIDWDVEGWAVSPDKKVLAFISNENGVSVLHLRDTKTLEDIDTPIMPAAQFSRLRWHPTLPHLALTINDPNSPSDVFEVDVPGKKMQRWTDSKPASFDAPLAAKAEIVQWKSFDGRMISGILYRPAAKFTGPRPVIVSIHGGPEGQSRPSFMGRWHYFLNEMGAAILFPNVRGSSGFGKTFLTLDNGKLREDSVKDIGTMLDWVGTQSHLDSKRIAITGGSYGGYMSLATSVHYADRISCAVDSVGIANFVSFLERTETYRRDLRRSEYGDERDPDMRSFLTAISPLTNAQKIKKPLFVVHGTNDPRVPFFEAQQIVAKVRANGTSVWTLYADNEGHGFAKRANADFLFYSQTLFFNECFR
jgi:dipeptidyl aminopeptidase/acylaminoacyl peptidase